MERLVILPTQSDEPAQSDYEANDTIRYVEDWFTPQRFRTAFYQLRDFEFSGSEAIFRDTPAGVTSIWNLVAIDLFSPDSGNLEHLLPFIWKLLEFVEDDWDELVLYWPTDDIFVTVAKNVLSRIETSSVQIRIDDTLSNPTPRPFFGDGPAYSSGLLTLLRSMVILLAFHVATVIGLLILSVTGHTTDDTSSDGTRHLLLCSQTYREVTDTLRNDDSILISTLPPLTFQLAKNIKRISFRELLWNSRWASSFNQSAEAVLAFDRVLTLRPYCHLYRAFCRRNEFAAELEAHLLAHHAEARTDDGPEPVPYQYLTESLSNLFLDKKFMQFFFYYSLIDDSEFDSTTLVSGGTSGELQNLLAQQASAKSIFHGHSALSETSIERSIDADIHAVSGKPDMAKLADDERFDGRLELTGRLKYDNISEHVETGHHLSHGASQMNSVLVATEPLRTEHIRRYLSRVFDADCVDKIYVKIHPQESKSTYKSLIGSLDSEVEYDIIADEHDLLNLINQCSVVVTVSSNVGLEALSMGTPAIHVLGIPCNIRLYYQVLDEFSEFAASVDDLSSTVDYWLKEDLDQSKLAEIRDLYMFDGQTSERLIDLMGRV